MKYIWIMSILWVSSTYSTAIAGNCGGTGHTQAVQRMAENYFDKIDLNGDQIINLSEFEKSKVSKMVKSFDTLQPDADGLVRRKTFIDSFVKAHSKSDIET